MNNGQKTIRISDRVIGAGEPPFVIAELSGNHNGDLSRAIEIVRKSVEAGADAIKLQTYTADTMTIDCDEPDFQITNGLWKGYNLYSLYEEAHTPWEWHEALFSEAKKLGVIMFSTPFDETSVEYLEKFDPPAYKVASFEIVDLELVRAIAATGRPMIISTGMASEDEIADVVSTAKEGGCEDLLLLHCVSGYPTPVNESNILTIPELMRRYDVPVGLSDHTLGTEVAIASIALGACAIEKHVTLRRGDGGPDAEFSLEPQELARLKTETANAAQALGAPKTNRTKSEQPNIIFRRSIYVVSDIKEGEKLSRKNIRVIRPGHGLAPKHLPSVLGKVATKDIRRGTALDWSHFK